MEEYKLHVERAEKAFEAFKILREKGLNEDAISRGYYAILHLCEAILLKNGLELPKTHTGLIAKLWQNRDLLGLNEDLIRKISRLQSLRENGDYGVISAIEEEDLELVESIYGKLLRVVEDD